MYGFPPWLPPGIEGIRLFYQGVFAAFRGVRRSLDDVVTEGDKVACRFTLHATHRGEFMGVPPTGKQVAITGMTILRFAGGTCVERWNMGDMLGLLQQLGAIPAPEQAPR